MARRCRTCGSLGEVEYGFYKYGFPDLDQPLPPAAGRLVEVVSDISSDRGHALWRCPRCGRYFDYELDYEFLIPGTEDSQTLRRITDEEAEELRARIEARRSPDGTG